ncbi:MAG: ribonuclease HIII [Solobacterium sp.]|nr:ribonuclease HIII [Solobacterium sp.]
MKTVITLVLTDEDQNRLFDAFSDTQAKTPQYAKWQLKPENCTITCYTSGKVVFQGTDCGIYAAPFMKAEGAPEDASSAGGFPQAGSDEVGTGDYFGPVCVCACIVNAADSALLQQLHVQDSKALDDQVIRRAGPQLTAALTHSLLILDPAKYNTVHETNNMNAIKAKMHNQAYVNLKKKVELPDLCVIDQFMPAESYYRAVRNEPSVIRGIRFETKAENKYPAVAAASVIARYAFLLYWDRMEETYGMTFNKGGGKNADESAAEFVRRYGFEKLSETAKVHFANTKKIRL